MRSLHRPLPVGSITFPSQVRYKKEDVTRAIDNIRSVRSALLRKPDTRDLTDKLDRAINLLTKEER